MNSLTFNDIEVERFAGKDIVDWKSLARGGFLNIGLVFKFRDGKLE